MWTNDSPGTGLTSEKTHFGTLPDGSDVDKYIFKNAGQMEVSIVTYGGIIQSILVPDKSGKVAVRPTMNAAFFRPGTITMHCDFSSSSCGMLSGTSNLGSNVSTCGTSRSAPRERKFYLEMRSATIMNLTGSGG